MSETKNLRLFKHNEPLETNENKFDIDLALNQNWDKLDEFAGMVNDKVIELEDKNEEQDFNLQEQNTKLEEKIKKDRENMINLEVEGQSIHVEDSSDLEGQLEVLGNVEQDVREGYNLFNIKNISNKFITDNGVEQANEDWVLSDFIEVEELTDYSIGWTSTSPVFQARIILYNKDKSFMQVLNFFYENMYKKTFRTIQNCKYIRVSYATSVRGQEAKRENVQLVKGTTEKPYEPYGASPSPEYPSEIRAVGDNINLLEITAKTTTVNGVTFTTNEDGAVIANGTATSLAQISLVANIKLPAGTYTIKDGKAYVESTEFNDWFDGLNNPSTLTFNTEVLLKNVYIQVKQGETVNNKIFSPKLEKGTEATSYSKFGQGSVEIKKTSANYYNVKTYSGSQQPPVDENDWITLTGNNTGTSPKYLNYFTRNLDVIVGEKYWIVAEVKNVLGKGTFNITSQFYNQGQFNQGQFKGYLKQIQDIKAGDVFIYQSTAVKTKGDEQGLRTFIELRPDESANITFRLSVLETEPNKSNWKYVPYKKENKILPIQKPMLEGDYFIKETDGWKEVHNWAEVKLIGTENWTASTLIVAGYFGAYLKIQDVPKNAELYCNYFKKRQAEDWHKLVAQNFIYAENGSIGIRINNKFCENLESFKNWLKSKNDLENSVYVYYKKETLTKLSCTPEQTKILDELDNFQTYKPVTNITTDSIAKLKLKYIADTKTYVDNKTSNLEQQVSVINQLLSTTKTSSVLLDNLQTDIESEVL